MRQICQEAVYAVAHDTKANSVEISKLFGYPHTIIDGGASEEDKRQFIAAVTALLCYIETELDSKLLLESEKAEGYYWAFDTKELTRGSQLERYQAYEIALKNHFLQVDEVRAAEDYDATGFNWLTMGLGDILLNPKTMEVFTPNTNQTTQLGDQTVEPRANDRHDPKTGQFAPKNSGGGVDKSGGSGIIKKRPKSLKIGKKERTRLSHQIATDFPDLKAGSKIYDYENRNHFYQFSVNDFGSYSFHYKIKIEGNQEAISKIRKGKL